MSGPETQDRELRERIADTARVLGGAVALGRVVAGSGEPGPAVQRAWRLAELERLLAGLDGLAVATAAPGGETDRRLREIELRSSEILSDVESRDGSVRPSRLRVALRAQAAGGSELASTLLGFYGRRRDERGWSEDRVDKVDLLLTGLARLRERVAEGASAGPDDRLDLLAAAACPQPLGSVELTRFHATVEAIRDHLAAAGSLAELLSSGVLGRYRELKHRLGPLLLHSQVRGEIVATNLALDEAVRRLYALAQGEIASTFQAIYDLGVPAGSDEGVRDRIDRLRDEFDALDSGLDTGRLRLAAVDRLGRRVRAVFAELSAARPAPEPEGEEPKAEPAVEVEGWLADDYEVIAESLERRDAPVFEPGAHLDLLGDSVSLESREVAAYRRLRDGVGDGELERFVLRAAALRRCLRRSARKMAAIGDPASYSGSPAHATAFRGIRAAEEFLARYSQAANQAVLNGDPDEARELQILRMRMMREYSGTWLQVHPRRA